jgi:hypothetical protein
MVQEIGIVVNCPVSRKSIYTGNTGGVLTSSFFLCHTPQLTVRAYSYNYTFYFLTQATLLLPKLAYF